MTEMGDSHAQAVQEYSALITKGILINSVNFHCETWNTIGFDADGVIGRGLLVPRSKPRISALPFRSIVWSHTAATGEKHNVKVAIAGGGGGLNESNARINTHSTGLIWINHSPEPLRLRWLRFDRSGRVEAVVAFRTISQPRSASKSVSL